MKVTKVVLGAVLSLFLFVPSSFAFPGYLRVLIYIRHVQDCRALAELCAVYHDDQSCTDFLNNCRDVPVELALPE